MKIIQANISKRSKSNDLSNGQMEEDVSDLTGIYIATKNLNFDGNNWSLGDGESTRESILKNDILFVSPSTPNYIGFEEDYQVKLTRHPQNNVKNTMGKFDMYKDNLLRLTTNGLLKKIN